MINKACFVLIVAMCPATLFAGETMVTHTTQTTQTTRTTTRCDFRVDKCATSVANDPDAVIFKDGTPPMAPAGTRVQTGDPSQYRTSFSFVDYGSPVQQPSVEELLVLIRSKLSNCPEVTVKYDAGTGDLTVHYLNSAGSGCDWTVNVRNVKTDDFVWVRTSDNYSPYLGQMERRKFHCTSEQDAQKIESACEQICRINNWTMYK